MEWQPCCSSRTLAISQYSTGLSSQLTIQATLDSYRGGVKGVVGPLISSPSFHFKWGTYLNPIFAFSKCYNYKFDIHIWLDWASPYPEDDSLRGSTHCENNWLLGSIVGNKLFTGAFSPIPQSSSIRKNH